MSRGRPERRVFRSESIEERSFSIAGAASSKVMLQQSSFTKGFSALVSRPLKGPPAEQARYMEKRAVATNPSALPHGDSRGTILGHPKGLFVLFFAEMWERFSYYGMRALLIFYLTKHWLFDDSKSNLIYGAYTSLVYITPVLGGYLADRYLGQRKAVLFGAVLLTAGHFLMAFEGTGGQGDATINIFWAALAFIIVGSGFLKANISVIVGQLYGLTDTRRDGAYTIFYIGINVGAAIGTILAGYLGETYGWRYGFGAAGVGMLLGLAVFVLGKGALLGRSEAPHPIASRTE